MLNLGHFHKSLFLSTDSFRKLFWLCSYIETLGLGWLFNLMPSIHIIYICCVCFISQKFSCISKSHLLVPASMLRIFTAKIMNFFKDII